MLKTTKIIIFLVFIGLIATACFREPNYADTPAIAFESIRNTPINSSSDSVIITIAYQDGDGDMGLASTDTMPPFQRTASNGQPNQFFNNYFLNIYKRVNGRYVPVIFNEPSFTLNSRYPRLNGSRQSAIEGSLRFTVPFFYGLFSAYSPRINRNDTIRFDVQVVDRALNKSNIVETTDIIMGRRN
ncbi:MAG: hypothetical protein MUE81_04275 [Thermoflexibacter sp.]|jgi:hypothetical protein|nr:hypothetical protein [Thermoflexibacter sp.]